MKWEYLVVHVESYMWESTLNTYGDDGWELTAITKTSKFEHKYTFKRPKQKDEVIA